MNKNISQKKIFLSIISLVITFFVWQQGLRDSLNRPSVSFDITQKEKEIVELATQSIPANFTKFIIPNDPVNEISSDLSYKSFDELTERNKLILLITSNYNDVELRKNLFKDFKNKNFLFIVEELEKKLKDNSHKINYQQFDRFKEDRFLYHILSKRFDFDDSSLITKALSKRMFLKILAIRFIPLLTIFTGSILILMSIWTLITLRKIGWKEYKPLDLDLIDMVLLISGGFVVLGEVISPLISLSLVQLFSKNLSIEIS